MERAENRGAVIDAAIFKIASRCNLNCAYCYLYNQEDMSFREQPKFMGLDTFRMAVRRLHEYNSIQSPSYGLSVVLHGGEPTLVGPKRLAAMCEIANEELGERLACLAMQTNATLLTDDIVEVIHRFGILVGISLDGDEIVHDRQRVFHGGRGSYHSTIAGVEFLRKHGIEPKILCVIQPGEDGGKMYRHFRSLGINSIDFLLPDVSHDNYSRWYGALGKTPVARYLLPAFDEWLVEDNPDVNVRLFESLIRGVLGGKGTTDALGSPLMSYLIVESNGDIEALDALKVCENGITKTRLNVHINSLSELESGNSLLSKAMFEGFDLPDACLGCAEKNICHGGYLPHRFSRAAGFNNPSVWCEDIKTLIAHVGNSV